jgi:hypothetical protein
MIVDEELVLSQRTIQHLSGIAYVDIQPSVGIYVHEHYAGAPFGFVVKAGLFRDVFEMKITQVSEKLVGALVSGEEYLRQSVIVQISRRYPTAIVEIPVLENIEIAGLLEGVGEIDACMLHLSEEWGPRLLSIASRNYERQHDQ